MQASTRTKQGIPENSSIREKDRSSNVGDLVRYVRANPKESHMVYQVAATLDDDDGSWVLLVEEDEDCPDAPIAPGIWGGFGCWEESKEFVVVS